MKLGVMSPVLNGKSLEDSLAYLSSLGVQTIELGCGGYPGDAHLDIQKLLTDDKEVSVVKQLLQKYNIEISGLSCHGNPVHPNKEIARGFHDAFINTVLVAERLGVDTVIGFSGCPGDCESSERPNWVTCAWPPDYTEILNWQWDKVLIPYWKETAAFAKSHGVKRIAFEMHPGFCVYHPASLLRLRAAVGDIIGANFDPSHLFWQGVDPVAAIRELKGAIYHFHAKDTYIDERNRAVNGVLDTGSYGNLADRSWTFRTVGYGHDAGVWKNIVSALRLAGYDGALSIEHEDPLMSPTEGLEKAIAFLKDVLIFESAGEMWWA